MLKTVRVRAIAITAILAMGATSAACGGGDDSKPDAKPDKQNGPTTALGATEKEFVIALDKASVPAGTVRVTSTNNGTVPHELVAFRTDLPVDKLPLKDGNVDEDGDGVTHMDPEAEDIKPGSSKSITLHLSAGRYVFICNVPGHYAGGMHTELTVS
ncbi:MAG: hypothetical protein QOG90_909 [Actinomycetota bacterium]|jgi:uncharacterized cupredoxin-like copper-binding protein